MNDYLRKFISFVDYRVNIVLASVGLSLRSRTMFSAGAEVEVEVAYDDDGGRVDITQAVDVQVL